MFSVLKYKVKKVCPSFVWNLASQLQNKINKKNYYQTQKSFGSRNKEIKIFVIRRKPPAAGLFSNVNHVLQGLIYSENKGYIPVVDMKNYATEYSKILPFNNTRNSWEYFFKPVSNISINEAYKSYTVILSAGDRILKDHQMSGRNLSFVLDKQFVKDTNKIYKNYIKLNDYVAEYLNYIIEQRKIDFKSTLGVFLRGTTYLSGLESGHPIQPNVNDVINDIYQYLTKNPIKQILFSTDDLQLRKIIKQEFNDLLMDSIRCDSESPFSIKLRKIFHVPNKVIARNLSYLSEIYLLSKLDYNISSLSNGSAMMHIINGDKFKENILYYLGEKNHDDKKLLK